jgi:opacity protein-like surface antigen
MEAQMTRTLIPTLVLFAAGFSTEVLADTNTDIEAESPVTDLTTDDTVEKKAKAKANNKKRAPASSQRSQAKPGKPAANGNPSKRVVHPQTKSESAKPATARPAAPANSNDREAAHGRNNNTTASHARPDAANKRPSSKKRPAPQNRPATNNAHPNRTVQVHQRRHVPARWNVNYHRYHMNGVPRHHPRYWSAGVFYYNPPPTRHKVVVVNDSGHQVSEPTRALDRSNSFGVGLSAGSYNSGYRAGGAFGDMGIGLTATYRPVEAVGFEIAWTHYDQSWDESTDRIHEPVQASVNLYAFPWSRVSPYATLGVTQTGRDVQDTWFDGLTEQTTTTQQTVFGPHAGLGVEFAMGSTAALDLETRYISYLDVEEGDPSASSAIQGTMGLKFYF